MSERRVIRRRIKASQRQEREGMEALGGQRHHGSGNGARKGDGRTSRELVEFKRTDKKQITIKHDDLIKICQEAALTGRIPVLAFELQGRHYVIHERDDWDSYRAETIGGTGEWE